MLEDQCHLFDLELAHILSNQNNTEESDFGDHIAALIEHREIIGELETKTNKCNRLEDIINWFIISGGDVNVIETHYVPEVNELKENITKLQKQIDDYSEKNLNRGTVFNIS